MGSHIRSFLGRGLLFSMSAHLLGKSLPVIHPRKMKLDLRGASNHTQKSKHPIPILHKTQCHCELVFTGALEDAGVAVAVSLSKRLHHSVDLLGFAGQTETPQELSVENRSRFRSSHGEQNFAIKPELHSHYCSIRPPSWTFHC